MGTSLETSVPSQEQRSSDLKSFFNAVRDPSTCRICTTPVKGFRLCWRCHEHEAIAGVADVVAPLVYAIGGTESAATLSMYKNHPVRTQRECRAQIVAELLMSAVLLHEKCFGAVAGVPVSVRTVIPSLTLHGARNGEENPFAEESRDLLGTVAWQSFSHLLQLSNTGRPPRHRLHRAGPAVPRSQQRTRPPTRRRRLSVRTVGVHGRTQLRPCDLRAGFLPRAFRNLRRRSRTHTRNRCDVGPPAPAHGTARPRTGGSVRPQWPLGTLGTAQHQPARIRRIVRRPDPVVVPHRGVPQLRDPVAVGDRPTTTPSPWNRPPRGTS